jgi:hypothetical protein
MKYIARPFAVIALALLAACAASTSSYPTRSADRTSRAIPVRPAPVKAIKITEDSFGCIRHMTRVRGFYVDNLLGDIADTLAAANKPLGGPWPPGSVIQRIPGEAMVKHRKGFSPATDDWEFFVLDVKRRSTEIVDRGFTDVINPFGGNCLTCHFEADPQWDMVCEQGHGCPVNPITREMAVAVQNTDPRCPKVYLPPNQKAALRQLAILLNAPPQRPMARR